MLTFLVGFNPLNKTRPFKVAKLSITVVPFDSLVAKCVEPLVTLNKL